MPKIKSQKLSQKFTTLFQKLKSRPAQLALTFSLFSAALSATALILSTFTYIYRPTKTLNITPNDPNRTTAFTEQPITDVVAAVSPSVVSIVIESERHTLFGANTSTASGTGVIITKDGHLITNHHVIKNATKVRAIRHDGTTHDDVTISGFDPINDIAYLKINQAKDLPAAKLGDSKTIAIGQPVIAIGNALGEFQNTVTNGIISGIGRSIIAGSESQLQQELLSDMLQTNASINPGNSGGPLVNAAGEVIGINTAVSKAAQGIGFAIPISSIKGTIKHFVATGKVERVYLGINYSTIDANIAQQYNLPVKTGAYIYSPSKFTAIIKDSPASKAGLKDKDIITAINGTPIGAKGSLATLLGEYSIGDTIALNIIRGDKEMSLELKLEAFPSTINN